MKPTPLTRMIRAFGYCFWAIQFSPVCWQFDSWYIRLIPNAVALFCFGNFMDAARDIKE
jgi:hypothetical protein